MADGLLPSMDMETELSRQRKDTYRGTRVRSGEASDPPWWEEVSKKRVQGLPRLEFGFCFSNRK